MEKLSKSFPQSALGLKQVSVLTVTAMLIAISVALHFFTVPVSEFVQISFSFIPIALVGMLYGPVPGAVAGLTADLLKFFIRPTGPFFFGFTLNALLFGLLFGCIFYRRAITARRIILAKTITAVFIDMLLVTLWVSIMYHTPFFVLLPMRILKSLIMLPIEAVLLILVSRVLERVLSHRRSPL